MANNNLTANIIADIQYRLRQTDEISLVEDHSRINYNLALGSGVGNSKVNEVWFANRTFTTTDSIPLDNLPTQKLGNAYTTSFLGVSNTGNIKGIKVDNLSNESIYLSLPFSGFSGSAKIGPSGSIVLSNSIGWPINTSINNINLSGDTSSSKSYNLGLLGVSLPSSLTVDALLNLEYYNSSISPAITGSLLIEYLASSQNSGLLNLEYNLDHSGISGILNVEYASSMSPSTILPIDYLSVLDGFDGSLEIEYSGFSAFSGSGTGFLPTGYYEELLQNPTFSPGYVSEEFVSLSGTGSGCNNSPGDCYIGYPHWYTSGDYLTINPTSTVRTFVLGKFKYTTSWLGDAHCVDCRSACRIMQTVNVIPGARYKFEWFPTELNTPFGVETGYPYVRLVAGDGTQLGKALVDPEWFATNHHHWKTMTVIAIDSSIRLEFYVPADKYPNSVPYDSSITYNNYLGWSGDVAKGRRVSMYRIPN